MPKCAAQCPPPSAQACPYTYGRTFGHLDTFPFLAQCPDSQIAVTYVSSHFAKKDKDRCPNALPCAEARCMQAGLHMLHTYIHIRKDI